LGLSVRHRTKLLAAALFAAMTETAFAGFFQDIYQEVFGPTQFEQAEAAFERGDAAAAMRLWRPLAEKGNAKAQYWVGYIYEHGIDVPRDYAEAAKWYWAAAAQNNTSAETELAEMYLEGRGVPRSEAKAVRLYCRAADRGDPIARNYLEKRADNGDDLYELCQ
jgi:TPR repeat protein